MIRTVFLCCLLLILPQVSSAKQFDHSVWAALLQNNVYKTDNGKSTAVDYKGFLQEEAELDKYLQNLSAVTKDQFNQWPDKEQLAFLINSYNSWTIKLILTKYPDLDSIKDLGSLFRSPWKKEFIPLLGKKHSLDYIEHELIRGSGRYNDPRIHFAVNCASIGCPALRGEPYSGIEVEAQLEDATALFLQDRTRNRLRNGVLEVSSLFKWYRGDFEKGWLGISSLEQFFWQHAKDLGLTSEEAEGVRKGDIRISFLKYDWGLNDR